MEKLYLQERDRAVYLADKPIGFTAMSSYHCNSELLKDFEMQGVKSFKYKPKVPSVEYIEMKKIGKRTYFAHIETKLDRKASEKDVIHAENYQPLRNKMVEYANNQIDKLIKESNE